MTAREEIKNLLKLKWDHTIYQERYDEYRQITDKYKNNNKSFKVGNMVVFYEWSYTKGNLLPPIEHLGIIMKIRDNRKININDYSLEIYTLKPLAYETHFGEDKRIIKIFNVSINRDVELL
jgi:hypothetical protein